MTKDHFKRQVKMLCEKNDLSEDLINLLRNKHIQLTKEDPLYKKSNCFLFLKELWDEDQDKQVLNYLKNEVLYSTDDF